MATLLYGNASQQFAVGAWNWPALTVWALLVDKTYVPSINKDLYVSDIPATSIIARQGPLTSLVSSAGVCSGNIPQFASLLDPRTAVGVVLYVNTGVDSTSSLIYYSSDGLAFPFLPQGFNYIVSEDLAAGGWFQV